MKFKTFERAIWTAMLITTPFPAAYAKHLSPDEALARIENNHGSKQMSGTSHFKLIHTEEAEGNEMVYVFNRDNGFVLVSANDNMPALLGYSDNGTFDLSTSSPALKWWISQYAEEGAQVPSTLAIEKEQTDCSLRAPAADKEAIPFMIKTQWGQQNPFNLDCPELKGSKCVTGCIATAMAQIIKYHGYPESGFGANSYAWNGGTITYDYGSAKFNYADMLDKYTTTATTAQKQAVANLLFACGVSVDMTYNRNESSAYDMYVPYALRHYFKYDNGVKYLKRSFFSTSGWEDLIYSELKEKRPVILGGQAPSGGHQFICDGYDGEGFFHINWGWEGLGDGYFLLTALNPDVQGTGGHTGGYNSNQSVICGIKPSAAGSNIWYPLYSNTNIGISTYSKTNIDIEFANGGGIFNDSPEDATVEFLLEVVSENGEKYLGSSGYNVTIDGAEDGNRCGIGGIFKLKFPKNLPAGDYKGHLVFKTPQGNLQKVLFPITAISYVNINISTTGAITCSAGKPESKAEIRVTEFKPAEKIIEKQPVNFYMTIENIGEEDYEGSIILKMIPKGSESDITPLEMSIQPLAKGESATYSFNITFPNAGSYDAVFYDQYGSSISNTFSISIAKSGVEEIIDMISEAEVYTSGGMLLKKNAGNDFVSSLPKGIYIIKSVGKTLKVVK